MNADVVIVGSGAAGLAAAITAAKKGFSAIVIEATPYFGGTTALSGGGVWIPVNRHQHELGVQDSRKEAETYLRATLGALYDAAKIATYLDTAPQMLEFFEQHSEVQLVASTVPDYEPHQPGWKTGRCLLTADYDGRRLGKWLDKLRPPIREMGLFSSMQVSPVEAFTMTGWSTSLPAFNLTVRRMLGYAADRVCGRRGHELRNGNALAGRLLKSAVDAGVTLLDEHRARTLSINDGRVVGVVADHKGEQECYTARLGVLLASGGFGANEAMRRELLPQADVGWSLVAEGNQGDGILMGIAAGGTLVRDNAANGIWVPASSCRRDDGSVAKFPSLQFDRHCPGSIMVDARTGKRFVDESFHYQNFGETTRAKGITKIWQISDSAAVKKYGIGMVKPAPFSPKAWVRKGYVIEAASIQQLAVKIGLDPVLLEQTIAEFNRYADAGKDPEFGRGGNYYSAYMGDARHGPNPALGALRSPPFYALEVRPSDLSTLAGLVTNTNAQVLDKAGQPIPGLYAAGLDNNAIMRGRYPGGGTSLGPAMTFGYIAACDMAAKSASATALSAA